MRVLITGISGFVGGHLVEYLRDLKSIDIFGTVYGSLPPYFERLAEEAGITLYDCDLRDRAAVAKVVGSVRPEIVIHLAAFASVADSINQAEEIITNNIVCELVLLETIRDLTPTARTLIVSSAEVYGKARDGELPIAEMNPLRPANPYAVSKLGQEFLAYQFYAAHDLPVIIARPFNHIGPRQIGNFVVPSFARQIAEIEAGAREPVMRVGNLESSRDFSDVRDVVRAYWLLATTGAPGEIYNVCSGEAMKIQKVLGLLLACSTADIKVETDPKRYRPADTPVLVGSYDKLNDAVGWKPQRQIERTLEETLDYWRGEFERNEENDGHSNDHRNHRYGRESSGRLPTYSGQR